MATSAWRMRGAALACPPFYEIRPLPCRRNLLSRRRGTRRSRARDAEGEGGRAGSRGHRLRLLVQSGDPRVGAGGGGDHLRGQEGRAAHAEAGGNRCLAGGEDARRKACGALEGRRSVFVWPRRGGGGGAC